MLIYKGIKTRLLTYIIISVLAVFLLIIFHNFMVSKKFILKSVKENAKNLSISSVNKIESILISIEKINKNQAINIETFNFSETELKKILYNVVKNNDEIFGSCIAFEPYAYDNNSYYKSFYYYKRNDSILFTELNNKNYNYFTWDWYQLPKVMNKAYWSEPFFDKDAGNIIMTTYSIPFYQTINNKKKLKGVITIDVSLSWLGNIVDSIKISKEGYAFLISQSGTLITHPRKDFIMNESIFSLSEEAKQPYLKKIGKEMINGQRGFEKVVPVSTGKKSWMYFEPLNSTHWSLAVIFPEKELYADLNGLYFSISLISFLGLLILIIVIIAVAGNITKPIIQLNDATHEIGNGNFNVKLPVSKNDDEISHLTKSIQNMQNDLKKFLQNFEESTINKEKMLSELKIAHDIQISFIPRNYPAFPELRKIDIFGQVETANEVGGDLFDFFLIENKKLCINICDVSSYGMPASLFMAFSRTIIRAKTQKGNKLEDIISEINNDLCIENDMTYSLSMFLGIIDLETGEMEYCNANHLPPIILDKSGEIFKLETHHNESLGLNNKSYYTTDIIKLNQDDLIILYTDGVTEAFNEDAEFYSLENLIKSIINCKSNLNTKDITQLLIKDVKNFIGAAEQTDDITILSVRYKG